MDSLKVTLSRGVLDSVESDWYENGSCLTDEEKALISCNSETFTLRGNKYCKSRVSSDHAEIIEGRLVRTLRYHSVSSIREDKS